jgi:hypothetical protein
MANPNPTCTALHAAELTPFLSEVPHRIQVVLDEAYCEFVTDPDVPNGIDLLSGRPNLVVLRTFSQAYGLAAMQVGDSASSPAVAAAVRSVSIPFAVNRPRRPPRSPHSTTSSPAACGCGPRTRFACAGAWSRRVWRDSAARAPPTPAYTRRSAPPADHPPHGAARQPRRDGPASGRRSGDGIQAGRAPRPRGGRSHDLAERDPKRKQGRGRVARGGTSSAVLRSTDHRMRPPAGSYRTAWRVLPWLRRRVPLPV